MLLFTCPEQCDICLMNHQRTHQTNPMAPLDSLDVPIDPFRPPEGPSWPLNLKSTLGQTAPSSPISGSLSLSDSNCPLCTQQARNADQFSAANFSLEISSNAVQLCARRIASFYPNLPFENQFMLNSNVHSRPNATEEFLKKVIHWNVIVSKQFFVNQ